MFHSNWIERTHMSHVEWWQTLLHCLTGLVYEVSSASSTFTMPAHLSLARTHVCWAAFRRAPNIHSVGQREKHLGCQWLGASKSLQLVYIRPPWSYVLRASFSFLVFVTSCSVQRRYSSPRPATLSAASHSLRAAFPLAANQR